LIAAIGVSIFLQDLARLLFGPDKRDFPIAIKLEPFKLMGADIPAMEIYILITAGVLMAALTIFINKTKYGKAIIASASDSEAARLMGINVNNMILLTFVIGSVLSGAAGVMVSMLYFTYPTMGVLPGLKAFCAAILGGVGNIPGAIIGGLLLGIAENLGAAYISSGLKDVFAFAILIIVLIFRPSGIMGKKD
jgi:branched-chain amino acid transport system permease protein